MSKAKATTSSSASASKGGKASTSAPAASASSAASAKPYVKKAESGAATVKKTKKSAVNKNDPRFYAEPRSFRVGGDLQPKRDLGRFVRWPRYVRIQRQKKILYERLKVPPAINQFVDAKLEKNQSEELFKFLELYRPETKKQKQERIKALASAKASGAAVESTKPLPSLRMGLHHVTYLIEQKKAKLVVIAADTDPIELVVWMPALCRKFDIPYIIVRSKSRLGALVHKKTASCLALPNTNKEDAAKLNKLSEIARALFNNNVESRRVWGGGEVGLRTKRRIAKREALIALEKAKKNKVTV